jgi:hypothetical protein
MAIYDTTTARGCLEVAEGKSRQPDAADLKRLAESLLTQAQDAGSSAGPVLDDCKDPGAGPMLQGGKNRRMRCKDKEMDRKELAGDMNEEGEKRCG